ncbi:efflux RND transporter periplasmic adaptor subunit [Phyllobacterium sp. OV277]|uniref:efflux RND transporter periplasmic adaptor subunit n=1 Tax=Phyllobacterium sp. OV277 TaxID=1882772 RepID=UPI001587E180|nr:efflux RND transporter periplasmic adaptor subunit [Phyllobacterium sp. OV277]
MSDATEANEVEIAAKPGIIAAARGVVDVEGGLLRLSAQRDGMIQEVLVAEGQKVKQGDILAVIDSRHEVIALHTAEAEVRQAQGQLSLLKTKLQAQTRQVDRLRRAAAGKAVSTQTLDEAEALLATTKGEIAIAEAALAAAESRMENSRLEIDMRTVRAPIDARIVHRSTKIGEVVSAQNLTELFMLLPETPRIVRAEIQEQFVKLIKPGMDVDVVAESGDGVLVKGRVIRIGHVLAQVKSRDTPGERVDVRTADCIISIPPKVHMLIGQRVVVRFKP